MWYRDLGVISIGAQNGGPEDGGLGKLKVELWRALRQHCTESFSQAVSHYALALRISGPLNDFGREGIDKLRRSRKEAYIGADIVVPEQRWRSLTGDDIRGYLGRVVREAICACLARLRKDGEPADEAALLSRVDTAIAQFVGGNENKEPNFEGSAAPQRAAGPGLNKPVE